MPLCGGDLCGHRLGRADVLGVLAAALGIAILADGLFKVRIAADSRAFGIRGWWMILVLAVITCGAGGLPVLRPWSAWAYICPGI